MFAIEPMSRQYIFVDAITGEIVTTVTEIEETNTAATAATKYSGTQPITTDSYNGSIG